VLFGKLARFYLGSWHVFTWEVGWYHFSMLISLIFLAGTPATIVNHNLVCFVAFISRSFLCFRDFRCKGTTFQGFCKYFYKKSWIKLINYWFSDNFHFPKNFLHHFTVFPQNFLHHFSVFPQKFYIIFKGIALP